jgi:hypothetical protein
MQRELPSWVRTAVRIHHTHAGAASTADSYSRFLVHSGTANA